MIVVDSSAFVEYYRPGGRALVAECVARAIAADEVCCNGIIQVEIVTFARGEAARQKLAADFSAFHWLELRRGDFELAQEVGYELRGKGVTIPTTDLIIAASTIRAGAILYHLDGHFEQIEQHSELRQRSFLGETE
ncbi:MAG: PIN domain-containing protein [Acidobacteriota bacterium]